ncbi:flagellin [Rhodanobacter sp. AS-Z3]|uniref:flagellin N-terminal helical domain-containing protein n=1 Tax=Rhodanobacter sp. AS-Z3 TaxID=3031330 RepID=UPI00247A9D74|nr:flagellin [Rhodanobacter sp. AS-Z3]WEN14618.1 flagellin [Rhodanobacter sp. AS-Z3]
MVMSVNTNISSLNAQKNLASTQTKLATAIERLSSGMRINSAKDDAAGLAISTRFTTQINGLNQAVSNANDGISLAQTTESALNEVTNNMQRIRTLAVQSANATNSDSDRAALDAEVQQRLSEITRISQQTTFNGRHVLDGSFGSAAFQIGANVGETISVNLSQGAGASDVGKIASATSAASGVFTASAPVAATAGTSVVTITSMTAATAFTIGGENISVSAQADQTGLVSAINTALTAAGGHYTASADSTTGVKLTAVTAGADSMAVTGITNGSAGAVVAGTAAVAVGDATPLVLGTGDLTLKTASGSAVGIEGTFKDAASLATAINAKGISGVSAFADPATGTLHLASQEALTVGGTKGGSGAGNLGFATTEIGIGGDLATANVKSVNGANDTISRIDSALGTISSMRSDLGAVQNRFTSTIANLQTISQNLSSSRSQIQDADFAQETANMSSANILQQAGVSVLAQANASTQSVLKLLQ